MEACGLIVEYNPLHNGHIYHIEQAKKVSDASCMIAIMSGSFLQRGEPAIIDKFYRTKAALHSGVDIVLELPYVYAVQSSGMFAKGAVQTLNEINASYICFGSESGSIDDFTSSYYLLQNKKEMYNETLKKHLSNGLAYPVASEHAYEAVGLSKEDIDLMQPNNILGFSYVNEILSNELTIEPLTIRRINSDYHEQKITSSISSATAIRNDLLINDNKLSDKIKQTIPSKTIDMLNKYKEFTTTWHQWEKYFPLLHYRVMIMSLNELANIKGVDEGLENRIKNTALTATSFKQWITNIKTKRYTWTRLQRMFVHILTNTTKDLFNILEEPGSVPYIRVLGLTKNGQAYLNHVKKNVNIPIISQLDRNPHPILKIEERVTDAYYSVLPPATQNILRRQERQPPIIIN